MTSEEAPRCSLLVSWGGYGADRKSSLSRQSCLIRGLCVQLLEQEIGRLVCSLIFLP